MKWLIFILLIPNARADFLLDEMVKSWNFEDDASESYEAPSDAEVYQNDNYSDSWELGTPDNIPEIEIIYDDSPCQL
jgi:hypothetical protein